MVLFNFKYTLAPPNRGGSVSCVDQLCKVKTLVFKDQKINATRGMIMPLENPHTWRVFMIMTTMVSLFIMTKLPRGCDNNVIPIDCHLFQFSDIVYRSRPFPFLLKKRWLLFIIIFITISIPISNYDQALFVW